jgi:hypothetical protein
MMRENTGGSARRTTKSRRWLYFLQHRVEKITAKGLVEGGGFTSTGKVDDK